MTQLIPLTSGEVSVRALLLEGLSKVDDQQFDEIYFLKDKIFGRKDGKCYEVIGLNPTTIDAIKQLAVEQQLMSLHIHSQFPKFHGVMRKRTLPITFITHFELDEASFQNFDGKSRFIDQQVVTYLDTQKMDLLRRGFILQRLTQFSNLDEEDYSLYKVLGRGKKGWTLIPFEGGYQVTRVLDANLNEVTTNYEVIHCQLFIHKYSVINQPYIKISQIQNRSDSGVRYVGTIETTDDVSFELAIEYVQEHFPNATECEWMGLEWISDEHKCLLNK